MARARTLYQTALELLGTQELRRHGSRACDEQIRELDDEVVADLAVSAPEWTPIWRNLAFALRSIPDSKMLAGVIGEMRNALAGEAPIRIRLAKTRAVMAEALASLAPPPKMATVVRETGETAARAQTALLAQPVVTEALTQVAKTAGTDYRDTVSVVSGISGEKLSSEPVALPWLRQRMTVTTTGNEPARVAISEPSTTAVAEAGRLARFNPIAPDRKAVVAQLARATPLQAVKLAKRVRGLFIPGFSSRFCVPPNPVMNALRLYAELNLYKLRTCRNIAGDERALDPYAAPTDIASGLRAIGAGGQVVLPGIITLRPTPYRYAVLIERAKQLVSLAQQIEAAFLSTLEKRDAEYFNLLKARQDIQLTRAGVRLQDLRVREAENGVELAELQRERAEIQVNHFDNLLHEGFIALEQTAIGFMITAAALHASAAAIAGGQAILGALTFGFVKDDNAAQAAASLAAAASTTASILQVFASHERRKEDWKLQRNLGRQDLRIGTQQIRLAQDRVRIVGQERNIADMQAEHAEATADFLANKFTNVELYDWMSDVLEGVYSFFLQQATAMAQLAANQLAFERQEIPPPFILADYWEAPLGLEAGGITGEATPDRRGLTGSTRLLQDIFKLDQYAFETNERKLQLTKTISLAQMAPAEFQRFRESGVMPFNTPLALFDQDFPGHYLRLIKTCSHLSNCTDSADRRHQNHAFHPGSVQSRDRP